MAAISQVVNSHGGTAVPVTIYWLQEFAAEYDVQLEAFLCICPSWLLAGYLV